MINGHGDDAFRYAGILHNFSSNIFSHADLSRLHAFLASRLDVIRSYPEPEPRALERLIADRCGVDKDCVLATSGATEAIYLIGQGIANPERPAHDPSRQGGEGLRAEGSATAVIAEPTFSEYADACRQAGLTIEHLPLFAHPLTALSPPSAQPLPSLAGGIGDGVLFLCNPNNPTGTVVPKSEVLRLAGRHSLLVLDQSYEDYTAEPLLSAREAVEAGNILQLHSLTKKYCVPGLRIGYVVGAAALVSELRGRRQPWSVNALAIEAAMWLAGNDVRVLPPRQDYLAEAQRLRSELNDIPGITAAPTQTNFMLCRIDPEANPALPATAAALKERLATRHGILIRDASNFHGLSPQHFRVAAQTRQEDDLLIACLKTGVLKAHPLTSPASEGSASGSKVSTPPAPGAEGSASGLRPLMLAGTGSDVGKSVLAAALCRIFLQDGYHPAPFKAQNMALNSYATPEGLEIGRAQAVQAEAAGIPCHTDMNPLLLKPQSDHTSQVVLHGRPIGSRDAYDFWRRTATSAATPSPAPDFRAEVCSAFDRLRARYNPIVMEGAGSISELNLRATDLVNMPMARHADAAVILVADIDRGGVFASVYGSIALQSPEDRARIRGIIINKFRGDLRLFDDGRRMLQQLCGVPVLGVIPYFRDIHIEEEDSVSLATKAMQAQSGGVNVAVVLLRHLSNFTDFDALERRARVHLYYTNNVEELRKADIIILPGSKSTLDDLRELRRNGCAQAIRQAHRAGTTVVGICGGYQMMGLEVCDPDHVEGDIERLPGLGLLPTTTTMSGEKVTRQVHFRVAPEPATAPASPAPPDPSSPSAPGECRVSAGCVGGATFPLTAYEIHMGRTTAAAGAPPSPFALLSDGRQDGYRASNRCWGTYLHGALDNAAVIEDLLAPFADRLRGAAPAMDYAAFRQEQYDRLADHVRRHLDMEQLYSILRR